MASRWTYRRKDSDIMFEAFQFNEVQDDMTRTFPGWFLDALSFERIEFNTLDSQWYLDRTVRIGDGDWLIWIPENKEFFGFTFTDSEFKAAFERVH